MKKTFTIKLDTELTIDFRQWGLDDAHLKGGDETKRLVINHFLEQSGVDEFDVSEKNGVSLFEAMAGVVKAQNEYCLAHKNEFEIF